MLFESLAGMSKRAVRLLIILGAVVALGGVGLQLITREKDHIIAPVPGLPFTLESLSFDDCWKYPHELPSPPHPTLSEAKSRPFQYGPHVTAADLQYVLKAIDASVAYTNASAIQCQTWRNTAWIEVFAVLLIGVCAIVINERRTSQPSAD